MPPHAPRSEDDLDLPPLDGEGDAGGEGGGVEDAVGDAVVLDLAIVDDLGDAFDDATGEDAPPEEIAADGTESGWLADSEEAGGDLASFDVVVSTDEIGLLEDEDATETASDDDLGNDEVDVGPDAGEEGPVDADDELREEDLPALDADEEGDVDDEALYDRAMLGPEEELRWDDRAWARVTEVSAGPEDPADDSGTLAAPGDDPKQIARDATWRRLDEDGRVTAATFVPGDGVVLALDGPDRPVLVRINTEGVARIIAEIEPPNSEDDDEPCRVTTLRWDDANGRLVASGTFGAQAFRPA